MEMLYIVMYGLLVVVTPPDGTVGDVEILFLKTPAEYQYQSNGNTIKQEVPAHTYSMRYLHEGPTNSTEWTTVSTVPPQVTVTVGNGGGSPANPLTWNAFKGTDASAKTRARCYGSMSGACTELVTGRLLVSGPAKLRPVEVVPVEKDVPATTAKSPHDIENLYAPDDSGLRPWMKSYWALVKPADQPNQRTPSLKLVNGLILEAPLAQTTISWGGSDFKPQATADAECDEAAALFTDTPANNLQCVRMHLSNTEPCLAPSARQIDHHFGLLWKLATHPPDPPLLPKLNPKRNSALSIRNTPPSCRCAYLLLERPR